MELAKQREALTRELQAPRAHNADEKRALKRSEHFLLPFWVLTARITGVVGKSLPP